LLLVEGDQICPQLQDGGGNILAGGVAVEARVATKIRKSSTVGASNFTGMCR
jgi:hypothetical protein